MATAVQKRKKVPTHTYYRAVFLGTRSPDAKELEQYRKNQNWSDDGEWLDGPYCMVDWQGYEAIWAVPIKRVVNADV